MWGGAWGGGDYRHGGVWGCQLSEGGGRYIEEVISAGVSFGS